MEGINTPLPVELVEDILERFILTTDPTVENRAAILRVCRVWFEIAEPLIYRHVTIFEEGRLSGLLSLTKTLDTYPNYATRIQSLTLRISDRGAWLMLSDEEIEGRFRFVEWMQNIKHISITIAVRQIEIACAARELVDAFIDEIPPSCQSFEVRIDVPSRNLLSVETDMSFTTIQNIPIGLRSLRMEPLLGHGPVLTSLTTRVFEKLEEVVIKSDRLRQVSDRETLSGRINYPTNLMSEYADNVVETIRLGALPALKRFLLYRERAMTDDLDANSNRNGLLKHVREITREELYHVLFTEGGDDDRESAIEQANRAREAKGISEDHERLRAKTGDKWLVYSNEAKEEEDLLGVLYTFKSYPFYYQVLEDRGCFFWCSSLNGTRMPVEDVAGSELTRANTEIPRNHWISAFDAVSPVMTRVRYTSVANGLLSGVLFKACEDLTLALSDD